MPTELQQIAKQALRLMEENEWLRGALLQLERWDMLSLDRDGHGVATTDAPWARQLIAGALRGRPRDAD